MVLNQEISPSTTKVSEMDTSKTTAVENEYDFLNRPKFGYLAYQHIKNMLSIKPEHLINKNDEKYIAQHKYDGKNTQIIFRKNQQPLFASRNVVLGYDVDISKIDYVIEIMDNIQMYLDGNLDGLQKINLYGEKYGPLSIDRIKYNKPGDTTTHVKFFDVFFDNVILSPKDFYEFAKLMEMVEFTVEILNGPTNLQDLLDMDIGLQTPGTNDLIEGVVIKRYDYIHKSGHRFLKRVNHKYLDPDYLEKLENKPIKKVEVVEDDFCSFINRSHVVSGYSKSEWDKEHTRQLAQLVVKDTLDDYFDMYGLRPKVSRQAMIKIFGFIPSVLEKKC